MGKTIAVVNQKGGVGKTTTSVNLAASLAALEKKCLVIDLDPQANATSGMGMQEFNQDDGHIYHVIIGQKTLAEVTKPTLIPFLFAAPSTADLIGFEVEAIDMPGREHKLKEAIALIKNDYDYIFIDCPPALSLLTINALAAADSVLVPLQAEYYALEGLSRLMETIELVKAEINPSLILEGIVLTMFDVRNNLSHQVEEEVSKHFQDKLWKTKIPRNIRLSEAPSFGKPIITYDIRSVGAQSYLALAEEMILKGDTHEQRTTSSARSGTFIPTTNSPSR